jgi:TIR domain
LQEASACSQNRSRWQSREEGAVMGGALFISYSHVDRRWMRVVRTHLDGALRDSGFKIWSDSNIRPGHAWESRLGTAVNASNAALVLASPEFLVSEWCQRELKLLKAMHAKGELSAIYWLLLRPCSWQFSGLASLQAVHEPADAAVEAVEAGPLRDQLVMDLCTRITYDLLRSGAHENPNVAFVRDLMQQHEKPYRPTKLLGEDSSHFSVVCQGLDHHDHDVVIKVLTNTPLHSLRNLFESVSSLRWKNVADPSVIRVHDIFTVGQGHAARLVIVSDLAPKATLRKLLDAKHALDTDAIGTILRRLAEALTALHACPLPPPSGVLAAPYQHIMGPLLPDNVFWDEHLRRPMISLVGVTNFLWHFFEAKTFQGIVSPSSGTFIAPEKRDGSKFDQRVDQYFLGMLALELLEGKHVFGKTRVPKPLDVLDASKHPWKRHSQLAKLVERLLNDDPRRRFPHMSDVVVQLRALEESERVLAKYAYRTWVQPRGTKFSTAFYKRFFRLDASAQEVFERQMPSTQPGAPVLTEAHHKKLMDSLVAVLNFRRGSDPSSIEYLVPSHRKLRLVATQLHNFRESFITTLKAFIDPHEPDIGAIVEAWRNLFEPALEELARKLEIKDWPPQKPTTD